MPLIRCNERRHTHKHSSKQTTKQACKQAASKQAGSQAINEEARMTPFNSQERAREMGVGGEGRGEKSSSVRLLVVIEGESTGESVGAGGRVELSKWCV